MYLPKFIIAGMFIIAGSASASTYTFEEHTYASMLVSEDLEQIKLGSIHIYRDEYDNTKLLDIAAEVLWVQTSKELSSETDMNSNPDKVAWLIRVINKSTFSRYRPMLEQILAKAKNEVIKSETEDALDDLSDDIMEAYVPGSVSLQEVRDTLKQAIEDDTTNPSIVELLSFNKKELLANVYEKLGLPDQISTGKGLSSDYKKTYIEVDYQGLGSVLFRIGTKKSKRRKAPGPGIVYIKLSGPVMDKMLGETSLQMLNLMINANNEELLKIAEILADNEIKNFALLDAVAERLLVYVSRDKAKGNSKAIALLCQTIQNSTSGRYREVMKQVKSSSKNRKVKKAASAALKNLNESEEPQYTSSSTME